MRKTAVIFLSLFCLIFASGFQEESRFRIAVDAVNVLVTVLDQDGRFVTNLQKEDFIIYEDGKVQDIEQFSQETDQPLRIGLLMDTSSSVKMRLEFEKKAAVNFLRAIMRLKDEAMLVEFDKGVTMLKDFTDRPTEVIKEIETLRAGGGTALLDAIFQVSQEKMSEKKLRQTIIVLSDGDDLHSTHSLAEAVNMAQLAETSIYAIGTSNLGATRSRNGVKILNRLTEETGGRVFFPVSDIEMEDSFDKIEKELRSQYSITYTPKNKIRDGKFRELEVRVAKGRNRPGKPTVRYKKGYYAALPM
jgi:VWFA-related protein